mmetsp:Transcript_23529/g.50819  ORF Transcript_23529/g.50819 Transcript_23529/m.50819 type:complete len:163 (-) Transcript_23529:729-1217(-)
MLESTKSKLAALDLRSNAIDNERAVKLASTLTKKNTPTNLNLGHNPAITETGWIGIFTSLQSRNCRLERLSLDGTMINIAPTLCLVDALTTNNTLRVLDLSENGLMTIAGWHALFKFLQHPSCKIEDLSLHSNRLNDEATIILANSLTKNSSSRILNIARNR